MRLLLWNKEEKNRYLREKTFTSNIRLNMVNLTQACIRAASLPLKLTLRMAVMAGLLTVGHAAPPEWPEGEGHDEIHKICIGS